jgi:hypothetical protein
MLSVKRDVEPQFTRCKATKVVPGGNRVGLTPCVVVATLLVLLVVVASDPRVDRTVVLASFVVGSTPVVVLADEISFSNVVNTVSVTVLSSPKFSSNVVRTSVLLGMSPLSKVVVVVLSPPSPPPAFVVVGEACVSSDALVDVSCVVPDESTPST